LVFKGLEPSGNTRVKCILKFFKTLLILSQQDKTLYFGCTSALQIVR